MSAFFKSAVVYRLADGFRPVASDLVAALERHRFAQCGAYDVATAGFACFHGDAMALNAADSLFIRLLHEEKILPKSVVDQAAGEKASELAIRQGYPVGRKQLKELKVQITEALLPRAFTKRKSTRAYLDTDAGWLVVEASSPAKAETFIEHLRKAMEMLPVTR